ncbi:MerR family transcriptional regulator [Vallitalea pronyensis]|uniref:MerR family transcriptional regulator n=1 Tax=Vallitalea pronyensis TaxID=1348613 RepID=A0A8J8MMN4_9FIRM|nr:MerR family transcriptional regulator [Vallitalea pronyensis]QUI24480.1 MerR family transcriptional regulator [Vallitalea pronyensis]
MRKLITIGELADIYGINISVIRFYERKDVLSPAYMDDNGYRLYGIDEIERLDTILFLRHMDIPMKELKKIIKDYHKEDYQKLLMEKKQSIRNKIERLQALEKDVEERLDYITKGIDSTALVKNTYADRRYLKVIDVDEMTYSLKVIHDTMKTLGKKWDKTILDMFKSMVMVRQDEERYTMALPYREETDYEAILLTEGTYVSRGYYCKQYMEIFSQAEVFMHDVRREYVIEGHVTIREEHLNSYLYPDRSYYVFEVKVSEALS